MSSVVASVFQSKPRHLVRIVPKCIFVSRKHSRFSIWCCLAFPRAATPRVTRSSHSRLNRGQYDVTQSRSAHRGKCPTAYCHGDATPPSISSRPAPNLVSCSLLLTVTRPWTEKWDYWVVRLKSTRRSLSQQLQEVGLLVLSWHYVV